jgi:hypothetical protein
MRLVRQFPRAAEPSERGRRIEGGLTMRQMDHEFCIDTERVARRRYTLGIIWREDGLPPAGMLLRIDGQPVFTNSKPRRGLHRHGESPLIGVVAC